MKPEDIQHGGSHYKDQPKHLQPIYLATALKLNPMEYSVLKYLLRHRKKGGLLDLQKMMHFAQMLWEENYGQAPQITYLTAAVGVEFEFHKQQPEAPFASLLQLLGLQITDAECAILQCLLRHKSNGKACELRELLQYGQWLIYSEYGMVAVLKQLDEPIDAEFEVVPESQPVTSDNPQESPACPWRFGDVIRTRGNGTDFDWTITEITPRGVECRTGSRGEISTFIPFASYKDYDLVKKVEADDSPACPFKVGDVIWHREDVRGRSEIKWKVTGFTANSVQVVSDDVYRSPSHIERQVWHRYTKVERPAAEPTELPECPFKVGDVIQSIKWPVYIFRVYKIRGDIMEADSVTSGSRFEIPREQWGGYRLKPEFTVDKPATTC